jgi:hypothetical protein
MSARELADRAAGLAEQRRAFHDVLHHDPKLSVISRTLFKSLFPALSKSLTPQQRLDAIHVSDVRGATPKQNGKTRLWLVGCIDVAVRRWRREQVAR